MTKLRYPYRVCTDEGEVWRISGVFLTKATADQYRNRLQDNDNAIAITCGDSETKIDGKPILPPPPLSI